MFGSHELGLIAMGGESIGDLRVAVARVEEKVDGLGSKLDAVLRMEDDHENRLRRLERAGYVAIGLAVASGGAAGAFSSMLTGA